MTCSEIREALSAMADGEQPGVEEGAVHRHLVDCEGCTAYLSSLDALAARTARVRRETVPPDLAPLVVSRARAQVRRQHAGLQLGPHAGLQRGLQRGLRWGIALAAIAALTMSVALTWSAGAAGVAAHESHECLSMTAALCVGLLYVALRPSAAVNYLPVLGLASLLLMLTSVADVRDHEVSVRHDLPHAGLVLGFVLVLVLAWSQHSGPRLRRQRRTRTGPVGRPRAGARWARMAAALGIATALVAIAGPASAHAVLESSTPQPGAVLATAPTRVMLTFDENVTLLPTSLRVFAPDGSRADDGIVGHEDGRGPTADVAMRATEHGTYLVSWRVVSADSHPVSGAFTFSVGSASAAPSAGPLKNVPTVAGLLGVARWTGYAGSALLVGGLFFGLLCRPRVDRPTRWLMLAGAGGLALGAVIGLLAQGALDAGLGLSAVGRPSLVREVLGTAYGRATLARLLLAVLGAGVVLVLERGRDRGQGLWLARWAASVLLALGVGVSFAAAGHAVSGTHRDLALVVDTVHGVGASVWLGGLVMLLVALRPGAMRSPAAVAYRFSGVALGAVVVIVASGGYQAYREVGAWGALTATTYGTELVVKLVVVAAMLALAAGSRLWLWRTLRPTLVVQAATAESAPPAASPSTDPMLGRLRRTVAGEMALGAVVLGISSALVVTQPAATAYSPMVSATLSIEGDTVQVSAIPLGERTMDLHLYVFGPNHRLSEPQQIAATITLPSQHVGPLPVALHRGGAGHRIAAVTVPIAGTWTLAVTVRTTAIDEATGYVAMPVH